MEELKIIYLSPGELTPYEGNARRHAEEDLSVIKASIRENQFCDPIGIWGPNNLIVEGHGRQLAALELGLDKVPCIRLDHLTEAQRREYALVHNKSAELSGWDFTQLEAELAELEMDFDMGEFGFGEMETNDEEEQQDQNIYTGKVDIPQYEPTGRDVSIRQMFDSNKYNELLEHIEQSNVTVDEKEFLRLAATRHIAFNYTNIAEYYANTNAEMQKLMEESALVIIDLDDAIKLGYATFAEKIERLADANG